MGSARRFCWLFLLISGLVHSATAQLSIDNKNYPDSLSKLLFQNTTDSIKARTNLLLSDYWSDKDTLKSRNYLATAKELSSKYPYLQALYPYYLASYYYDIDIPQSEQNYLKADKLLSQYNTQEAYLFRAKSWANYANLKQRQDNSTLMVDILLNKAIPMARKAEKDDYVGKYYGDVALEFMNRWQYEKAEAYYDQSIHILENCKLERPSYLFAVYINACTNNLFQRKSDVAKKMLDKAKLMLPQIPQPLNYMDYYMAEAIYLKVTKQYGKGLESIHKGITVADKINNAYYSESFSFQKYKILTEQGEYNHARDVLEHIIKNYTINYTQNRVMHYYELSETYNRLGNTKMAYTWLKNLMVLKDSLSSKQIDNQINELEIKYQNAEKQKEIAALNAERKQNLLTLKNNRLTNWLLLTACSFLLAMVIFIYLYYKNHRKLARQTEINFLQKVSELEQKQQLEITKAMLDAEEKERTRVARDLHDGLGGMLSNVKMNLTGWATGQEQDIELQRIISQLDHSVTELRYIARNMMPQVLLQYGLETAIKELCESFMANDLYVVFQALNIERSTPLNSQISIYRIIQEILANVLKHADATEFFLQCSQDGNRFYITAEDNGKGFDPAVLEQKRGLGLNNIRNRVEYLNGKMEIASAPHDGTVINIEINVERK